MQDQSEQTRETTASGSNPGPDPTGPIRDEDVAALARDLQADADLDVRVDVTEASEHIGTGTDQ